MNKCPRCLSALNERAKVCPACGGAVFDDLAGTLHPVAPDETAATEILEDESMTPEKWRKIKALFEAAQDLPAAEREKFLQNACADDDALKREVGKLLGSFDAAESFLESPAAAEAGTLFENAKTLNSARTTGGIDHGNFVAGTVLDNRYRIIGLLGKGGMGEVYKAEDLKLGQIVALKFLPEKLEKNADALRRFIGEVRTARQVSHANVCKVYDIGEFEGKHFLSMEFIDGDDLAQLLRRIGRLPSERAAEISRQICFGLHAIHDAGILHRDLKPANIIIDSNGRARITDFGIAGLEEDLKSEEIRVGTPAYMSPEQIAGRELTPRSDIYSCGLLLYEIYTGRQAFTAESLAALIEKHRTTQPTDPSVFVENIDPLVEKTINRCLEKDPADRPQTALQVALSLPGGNPLEAALAAGETPSPEMVAAAPKKGVLKPLVASGLLLAVIIVFVLLSVQQERSKIFNIEPPEKQTAVLAEKSRQILEKSGYTDTAADAAYGFQEDLDYVDFIDSRLAENKTTIPEIKNSIASGEAPVLNFLYRQSPVYLEPKLSGKVTDTDPAFDRPGMVNVKLDPRGRLVEFAAVPPAYAEPAERRETDWNALFAEAGLDYEKFEPVETNRTPPVFADERIAWEGGAADSKGGPLRIEAASLHGKPVFFSIVRPWKETAGETRQNENVFRRAGVILIILIYCAVVVGSIILAWNNLKAGRGDLRGALKLSIFLFALFFGGRLIYADHVPTVRGELGIIYLVLAGELIPSLFIGLIYIALEPFVRRYWSELLISWNRLLKGDFRDPLIGRDILFGFLLGMGHTFGIFFGSVVFTLATGNEGTLSVVYMFQPVDGLTGSIYALTTFAANAVSGGFVILFVLLGIYMITKKKNLSLFLVFFLVFALQGLIFVLTQHWGYVFGALINSVCFIIALSRFGLVGMIFFWLGFYLTYLCPLTLDSASLYMPHTIVTFVVVLALAVYAFYISTGGQMFFGGKVLNEFTD
jgi:serine/threonine protein kinase